MNLIASIFTHTLFMKYNRKAILNLTRKLVKEGHLKRGFFDSPRTLYETLSVYPYNGKGLMMSPSEWIQSGHHDYYIITKSIIDKRTNLEGVIEGYLKDHEISRIPEELAMRPWRTIGRAFNQFNPRISK